MIFYYFYTILLIKLTDCVKIKQTVNPTSVGINIDNRLHFRLLVSLAIVKQVVEQGQWNKQNSITDIAVVHSHPLLTNISFN